MKRDGQKIVFLYRDNVKALFLEFFDNISDRPVKAIKNLINKFSVFWLNIGSDRMQSLGSVVLACINSILIFLAFYGFAITDRKFQLLALPIVLLGLYLTAIHTLFYGTILHSSVLTPYILIFAAKGMNTMMLHFSGPYSISNP